VALYFDLIHDQFHTLFHRPSFTESVALGEAPPVILYAMLALSARFVVYIHAYDPYADTFEAFQLTQPSPMRVSGIEVVDMLKRVQLYSI
jgi:hypothetical protein